MKLACLWTCSELEKHFGKDMRITASKILLCFRTPALVMLQESEDQKNQCCVNQTLSWHESGLICLKQWDYWATPAVDVALYFSWHRRSYHVLHSKLHPVYLLMACLPIGPELSCWTGCFLGRGSRVQAGRRQSSVPFPSGAGFNMLSGWQGEAAACCCFCPHPVPCLYLRSVWEKG